MDSRGILPFQIFPERRLSPLLVGGAAVPWTGTAHKAPPTRRISALGPMYENLDKGQENKFIVMPTSVERTDTAVAPIAAKSTITPITKDPSSKLRERSAKRNPKNPIAAANPEKNAITKNRWAMR